MRAILNFARIVAVCATLPTMAYASGQDQSAEPLDVKSLATSSAVTEQPPASTFTLRTLMSSGVSGNLPSGTVKYNAGAVVAYNFAPVSGYSAAVVVIDGAIAPSSGVLKMNQSHYLWAYGNPSAGASLTGMMVAPTDVTQIPYPNFFLKQPSTTVTVPSPHCAVASDTIAYPNAFLGTLPMPAVNGAPLPKSVRRGVGDLDSWEVLDGLTTIDYPWDGNECPGKLDVQTAFPTMIDRFKKLGADHITLAPAYNLFQGNNPTAGFDTHSIGAGYITDPDLKWMAEHAQAAGLKVWLDLEIGSVGDDRVPYPMNADGAWVSDWVAAWTKLLNDRATFAQQIGAEVMTLDWDGVVNFRHALIVSAGLKKAALEVRKIYKGKLLLTFMNHYWSADPSLLDYVDLFRLSLGNFEAGYSSGRIYGQAPYKNVIVPFLSKPTVFYVKVDTTRFIHDIATLIYPRKPKIAYGISIQSFQDYLLGPYYVDYDVMCSLSAGVPITRENCPLAFLNTDFALQAIAHEGFMEAITKQNYLPTYSVDTAPARYWHSDTVMPSTVPAAAPNQYFYTFPNISASIRGKPVEALIYQWFK